MAGLFFTGILCLNSGAFGYVPSDEVRPTSEVVFIDPSVPEIKKIVAQLPQGAEVVRLSPGMDGVGQISTHLARKRDLSTIHIISHGNSGHFVVNGKRIDSAFLRDHGDKITQWGRALADKGDILLYACNLAATDEGKAFVERLVDLTGADVAASTDVTGGEAFDGNWNLEYSIGRIAAIELEINSDIDIKLPTETTWDGGGNSRTWSTSSNWTNGVPTGDDDAVVIGTSVFTPDLDVSTQFASFTISSNATLNIISGGAINTAGNVTNNGLINAAGTIAISITAEAETNLNGDITSSTGAIALENTEGGINLTGDSTISSAGGAITLGAAVTINDVTLIVGTGNTGAISFSSTIDSAAESTGNLTINTDDTATFSNHVGEGAAIGTLTLTTGNVSTGTKNITAGTIAVNGGTFGLADSPAGDWDVGDVTIASGATMNATTGDFNVSGDWSNSGTFNHKDGTVTLDGTNQTLSGTTSFYQLTKNVNAADTLTFTSGTANRTTVTNTLNLKGQDPELLSLRSTDDAQWEIDPQGTRTIEFLDVEYSNNVSATNINAFGNDKNCTDSGNNTKWSFTQLTSGTYYVDTAGNDSNAGTAAAPWKTLHYAIDRINNGATGTSALPYALIMAAGTYSISNGESAATLIVSQSNVAIIGPDHHTIGAGTAIIDGTGTSINDWIYGINPTGSNITIKDLSIKNFSAAGQYGIYMSASTGTEVNNCKISNNHTGIELAAGSNTFKIQFCEIYENTTDGLNVLSSTGGEIYRNTIYRHQDDGIAVFGCSPAIKRNKIYDNDTGIRVEANSTASPDIINNIIYETTDYTMNHGILVTCLSGGTARPTIYHNTIDGGSGDGIEIDWRGDSGDVAAPVIKYNIITRCNDTGSFGINANAGATCAPNYNDVWGNATNYSDECNPGNEEIHADPKNGPTEFKLPSDSPCRNAIPGTDPPGDPVTIDYHGYSRPGGTTSTSKDMGACEYIPTRTDSYTLPGGSGLETDYDIFTVPLYIGTGQDMRNTMESTLGAYDPTHWRVFARTTSGDIEMNTPAFASLDIKPGMGFWGITVLTEAISFQGTLAPDAIYYVIELAPGWHLFAVPWPGTNINLGKIYVTDGVNQFPITDASNTLTEKHIWDYTGTGPNSGYEIRDTSGFSLAAGTGYFIKVLGSSNIIVAIPPNNSSDPPYNSSTPTPHAMSYESLEPVGLTDDPEPPPLPGGSYGPVPDIRANELGDNMTVSNGTPVSITVSLDPGNQAGENADWWVVAHTPFTAPLDWYSYVYPEGWRPGIYPCVQTPLFQVPPSFEVLNMALPPGGYTFYFAIDENMDGIVDETWVDSVDVRVE
jgi:parallel beta-helix repeat protein